MEKKLSITLNLNMPFASEYRLVEIAGIFKVNFKLSNQLVESNEMLDCKWKNFEPYIADKIIEIEIEGEFFGQQTDYFIRRSAITNSPFNMQIIFENNETMYGEFYVEDYSRHGKIDQGESFFVHICSTGPVTEGGVSRYPAIDS